MELNDRLIDLQRNTMERCEESMRAHIKMIVRTAIVEQCSVQIFEASEPLRGAADHLFWNTQQVMASSWNFEEETK